MFDQNPNPQNHQGQPPASARRDGPSNLPFGQPQSPFVPVPPVQVQTQAQAAPTSQLPPNPSSPPISQSAPIEDMFAATDKSAPPVSGFRPQNMNQPLPVYQPSAYQAGPAVPSSAELFGGRGLSIGKIITVVIIIVVLIAGVGAVYWGYQYFVAGQKPGSAKAPATVETPANTVVTPTTNSTALPASSTNIIETSPTTTMVITEENKDSDGDGLTDVEEKALGTNPNVADTDTDGLTDWAEVKIYRTDPLNPDTDGDGYKDGEEVINGYDPLKPGNARLYTVPQATSTN